MPAAVAPAAAVPAAVAPSAAAVPAAVAPAAAVPAAVAPEKAEKAAASANKAKDAAEAEMAAKPAAAWPRSTPECCAINQLGVDKMVAKAAGFRDGGLFRLYRAALDKRTASVSAAAGISVEAGALQAPIFKRNTLRMCVVPNFPPTTPQLSYSCVVFSWNRLLYNYQCYLHRNPRAVLTNSGLRHPPNATAPCFRRQALERLTE